MPMNDYNFGFLDEQTKKMIRRAILKGIAIPGYQVPFGSREMPFPFGWGTGGIQVTASIIGRYDRLKVIDQGADDTTNAINIRNFFQRVTGVRTTESTAEATIIQTRHRIPEQKLTEQQILVYQVPQPEPLWNHAVPKHRKFTPTPSMDSCGSGCMRISPDIDQSHRLSIIR
jgi:alpha-D-ribose 1-methylphosphonate 5-phosphate C-P lyase